MIDGFVDAFVPLSFGAPGLRHRRKKFAPLPAMDGKHVVITGANRGIGRAATEALVGRGAHVTMVCRDRASAEGVVAELDRARRAAVDIVICDMARLEDVARLAWRLSGPVDAVIHNAGVLPPARIETVDGFELTWAVHVVGPHLLTRLLWPRLSPSSRVVLVSSGGMYLAPLVPFGTVPHPYDGVGAYARTKRAQVVLAELWAEHHPRGAHVVAMHPGWVDTGAVRTALPTFHALTRPILRSPSEGADTIAWLASCDASELARGGFYFDRSQRRATLVPWQRDRPELRAQLWDWCNAFTQRWC